MIERRLRSSDVAEMLNCSQACARYRMRQMEHTEKPLTVTERAVSEWLNERTYTPLRVMTERPRKNGERHRISRVRTA